MLTWQFVGIIGLVAIAACWIFAIVLFRVGAPDSVSRKLALVMVVEGAALFTSGVPESAINLTGNEQYFVEHPGFFQAYLQIGFALHTLADCAMIALYPPFLAAALRTKWTRPFAGKRGRIASAIAAVVLFALVATTPLKIGATLLYLSLSTLFGFALLASFQAWQLAEPGIARTRAKVFTMAFGFRDICWGIVYLGSIWMIWVDGTYESASGIESQVALPIKLIYVLGTLIAIPIIAYGILRTQLFDIDLKIRWTIKQSAFGFAVVAIIYVLSEGAEFLLSEQFGTIGGLVGAGIVVILLQPLKRFADRVASAAMPNTQNTPEYASTRKILVYESAFAEALAEGGISQKERNLLAHLRDSLGLQASEAEAIELQLQSGNLNYG
jgi:hypothetical protein